MPMSSSTVELTNFQLWMNSTSFWVWVRYLQKDSESGLDWNWIELGNPKSDLNWIGIELKTKWNDPIPAKGHSSLAISHQYFLINIHINLHRLPVNSPHKGKWRGTLMFSLICARTNGWVNNRDACDLRCYRVHYEVTVMIIHQFRGRSSRGP